MVSPTLSESTAKLVRTDGRPAGWAVSSGYIGYPEAVAPQEARAAAIRAGAADHLHHGAGTAIEDCGQWKGDAAALPGLDQRTA